MLRSSHATCSHFDQHSDAIRAKPADALKIGIVLAAKYIAYKEVAMSFSQSNRHCTYETQDAAELKVAFVS